MVPGYRDLYSKGFWKEKMVETPLSVPFTKMEKVKAFVCKAQGLSLIFLLRVVQAALDSTRS